MGKKLTAYGVYLAKTSEEYLNKYQHRYAIHIKELGVSEDTLDRFMGGNIINDKNFDTICEKLRIPNLYFLESTSPVSKIKIDEILINLILNFPVDATQVISDTKHNKVMISNLTAGIDGNRVTIHGKRSFIKKS